MQTQEKIGYSPRWVVRKYHNEAEYRAGATPYEEIAVDGNLLLNEGIGELLDIIGGLGTPTKWDNTNARLGVGNSTTAAAATQTALQGASQLYKGMETSYPQRSAQTMTWRAVFTDAEANFAWEEVSLDNGSTPSKNLNRKVQALGTKTSGTWTLDLQITLS